MQDRAFSNEWLPAYKQLSTCLIDGYVEKVKRKKKAFKTSKGGTLTLVKRSADKAGPIVQLYSIVANAVGSAMTLMTAKCTHVHAKSSEGDGIGSVRNRQKPKIYRTQDA